MSNHSHCKKHNAFTFIACSHLTAVYEQFPTLYYYLLCYYVYTVGDDELIPIVENFKLGALSSDLCRCHWLLTPPPPLPASPL